MRHIPTYIVLTSAASTLLLVSGCGGSSSSGSGVIVPPAIIGNFSQTNLVSDQPGVASITDPNLVNPWGVAFSAAGPFWIADNNSNLATVYSGGQVGGAITNQNLNVTIPFGNPTGQVFNTTSDFVVTQGANSAKAFFIFASETGWIDGWNPSVNPSSAIAPTVVPGAVYKGLALGTNATGNFLFATNFAAGTVDVFDKNFAPTTLSGNFTDPGIPAGFAPFGIQNFGGTLYVSYAKQDSAKHDDQPGPGNGFVDKFDTNGNFLGRLISQGKLNSPWGMAMTPASFGAAGNMLLVGNFGDGKINVYNPASGSFVGALGTTATTPMVIDGLWNIGFGNGGSAGDTTSLYFTAGPAGESHGLFGRINVNTGPVVKPPTTKH